MKKNIICILIMIILLVIAGYVGYQKGQQSATPINQTQIQDKIDTQIVENNLEITQEKCEVFLEGIYSVSPPSTIADCSRYVDPYKADQCRFGFISKEINSNSQLSTCDNLSGDFKIGCQRDVATMRAITSKDISQCDVLPQLQISLCKTQAVDAIIQTTLDKQWCEQLSVIGGPEQELCLENLEIYKQRGDPVPGV